MEHELRGAVQCTQLTYSVSAPLVRIVFPDTTHHVTSHSNGRTRLRCRLSALDCNRSSHPTQRQSGAGGTTLAIHGKSSRQSRHARCSGDSPTASEASWARDRPERSQRNGRSGRREK